MIGRIAGLLLEKNPPQVLLDANGVGYEIDVPMSTFYNLPAITTRARDAHANPPPAGEVSMRRLITCMTRRAAAWTTRAAATLSRARGLWQHSSSWTRCDSGQIGRAHV